MKEIKNRIVAKESEAGLAEIFYLTPEVGEMNSDGYQEMNLATRRKILNLETFQVNSKVSKEQINDLQTLHGVDTIGMIKSVLENESQMQTQKLVKDIIKYAGEQHYKMGFSKLQMFLYNFFSFIPKKRIKSEGDIPKILITASNKIGADSRLGPANYIIVSAGLGARIMDLPQFVFNDPNQPSLDQGTGFIYKTGILGTSLEVLIDPMMKYNDMTVIVGKNSQENSEGVYMAFCQPEWDEIDLVGEDLMPYTMVQLRNKLAVQPTDNAHLNYLTFEFTDKPHNIFTHLWNKLSKKKESGSN